MIKTRLVQQRKRIALVAHDNKKKDLIEWAVYNKTQLATHELLATGTTGKLLEKELDRPVKKLLSGPLGGDQHVGTLIAVGEIHILIFFCDLMQSMFNDCDVIVFLILAIE